MVLQVFGKLGDWTTPKLRGWKMFFSNRLCSPCSNSARRRKNATDSALIVDAMDLLSTEKLDGFCIV